MASTPEHPEHPEPGDPAADGEGPGPELDPRVEARLRGLLADARHDAPIPVDVAERLDRVIAQLAGERTEDGAPGHGSVTALAARRRRRVATTLLAAAAVVVVGVGVGQVVGVRGTDDAGTTAGSSAENLSDQAAEDADAAAGAREAAPDESPAPAAGATLSRLPESATLLPAQEPQVVRPARFSTDVRRVLRFTTAELAASAAAEPKSAEPAPAQGESDGAVPEGTDARGDRAGTFAEGFACKPAAWGSGLIVPVIYDGEPAVLAFRPPTGQTRVAELLQCGSGDLLRSVTLQMS